MYVIGIPAVAAFIAVLALLTYRGGIFRRR